MFQLQLLHKLPNIPVFLQQQSLSQLLSVDEMKLSLAACRDMCPQSIPQSALPMLQQKPILQQIHIAQNLYRLESMPPPPPLASWSHTPPESGTHSLLPFIARPCRLWIPYAYPHQTFTSMTSTLPPCSAPRLPTCPPPIPHSAAVPLPSLSAQAASSTAPAFTRVPVISACRFEMPPPLTSLLLA